ncbi:uncharacterized protein LOC109857758 [Pseudomyrmex gracilis]|uniref:uncharacterized protein LOC109857758 n=1 Tax=Pseudomyrmex gracilis TaxID=219809 RepID=UPI000994F75C|nr:uncharacterized protein LOC109857758 [Pseudomyrmex gracilis]
MDNAILVKLLEIIQIDSMDVQIINSLREVLKNSHFCWHTEYLESCSGCNSRKRRSLLLSSNSITPDDISFIQLSLNSIQLLKELQNQTLELSETCVYTKELILEVLQTVSIESLNNEYSVDFTSESLSKLKQLVDAFETKIKIIKSLGESLKDYIRMQQKINLLTSTE